MESITHRCLGRCPPPSPRALWLLVGLAGIALCAAALYAAHATKMREFAAAGIACAQASVL